MSIEQGSHLREIEGGHIRPTKLFYEKNPRSKLLREIGVNVTANLARILFDKSVDDAERQKLLADLRARGEELTELGIKPDIHVGRRERTFYKSSVIMAEYVTGQLLPYTGYQPASEQQIKPVIQEFNESDDSDNYVIAVNEQTPAKLEQFWVDGWIVGNAIAYFDCEDEVQFNSDDDMK